MNIQKTRVTLNILIFSPSQPLKKASHDPKLLSSPGHSVSGSSFRTPGSRDAAGGGLGGMGWGGKQRVLESG